MFDGVAEHQGRVCDVGVCNRRISDIGDLKHLSSKQRIDCSNLCMIPGMIDVHTHADLSYFNDPLRSVAIKQGITTEICSACGIGVFPLNNNSLVNYHKMMSSILGILPHNLQTIDFNSFYQSLPPTSINTAFQVAHSPLHISAKNGQYVSSLSLSITEGIKRLASEALEQGCVGISTGLSYYPISHCDTDELFALGDIATEYNVPFTFHLRNRNCTNSKYRSPIDEVIDVARHCGCHVVFSHYRTYPGNCGSVDEICFPIENALEEGLQISADFYPFEIGCTYALNVLPPQILQNGPDYVMELLHDKNDFNRLKAVIEKSMKVKQHSVVLHAPNHNNIVGLTYKQIAEQYRVTPAHIILQLLKEESLCLVNTSSPLPDKLTCSAMEEDFASLINKPYYNIGSDTIPSCSLPHPRSTSAFIRILEIAKKYHIDYSIVANRTSYSAAKLYGLKDRGEIIKGAYADLVIFDPNSISSSIDYLNPYNNTYGIKHVVINGEFAIYNEQITNNYSGMHLKRGI